MAPPEICRGADDDPWDWDGSAIYRHTVVPDKRRVLGSPDVPVPTDLREWLASADSPVLKRVVSSLPLPRSKDQGTFDERARAVWQYVNRNIAFRTDRQSQGVRDFWQFPEETLSLREGDCDDVAFLLATLLLACGVSPFCVRAVLGKLHHTPDRQWHHAWTIYKDERGVWRLLECGLKELPITWPAADAWATPVSYPYYEPDICFNQYHVWTVDRLHTVEEGAGVEQKRGQVRHWLSVFDE